MMDAYKILRVHAGLAAVKFTIVAVHADGRETPIDILYDTEEEAQAALAGLLHAEDDRS